MVCTYNFFTGDRIWRRQTGEIAPLWGTTTIFIRADGHFLTPPSVDAPEQPLHPRSPL